MNKESALSFYLGCEDVEEAWEERFLAHIEFFRTKVAVPKLFQNRIVKLENDWRAAESLLGEQFDESLTDIELPNFSAIILTSVQAYYASLAEIHGKMHHNPNPPKTIDLAEKKLQLTQRFTAHVSAQCDWSVEEDLAIGIEPDPMRIFESIRNFDAQGVSRFDQLKPNSLEPLVLEIKRWLRLSEQYKDYHV